MNLMPTIILWFLALLCLLFGEITLNALGYSDGDAAKYFSFGATVFLLLVGGLFEYSRIFRRTLVAISELERRIKTPIPCYGGLEGLARVADRLPKAAKVLNTRIISDAFVGDLYNTEQGKGWNRAICKAVIKGTEFIDIVGGASAGAAAQDIRKELGMRKQKPKGSYSCTCVTLRLESFLNFKVIFYEDSTAEVWFGWRVTPEGTINDECFCTQDEAMVRFFEKWHEDLRRSQTGRE